MRTNELLIQFDTLPYPVTTERLIEQLDDPEIQHPNGDERLSSVFERIAVEELSSSDDAKLTVLSCLSSDAIGRKHYSDREPPLPCECETRPNRMTF